MGVRAWQWGALVVALALLHVSLTFVNVWPTLRVRAGGDLSVELAVAVLALAGCSAWRGRLSDAWARTLACLWVVLIIGRYIDVTTRSLYGREVNLYWDFRHVPKVGAMFASVATPWQIVGVFAAAVVCPLALYAASRWCFAQLSRAVTEPATRWVLGLTGGVICLLFVADRAGARAGEVRFTEPVASAYVQELYEFVYEMSGAGLAELGDPPSLTSDFGRVAGADVFIVFMESYGAVSWDQPAFVDALAGARAGLSASIENTGRDVVSGLVESTTFGGESWLAHISLLTGTEVRDDRTNARLMAQDRDTLVKAFGRQGYRTVAIMPGHLVAWPEGEFYGFDEVYDHARLDYRGPPFGWWSITDQYALARVDRIEIAPRERAPRFVFFTTLSTHAPFTPAPPYQSDWSRVLTGDPYDPAALDRAWSDWPDWLNLGPGYVKALQYAYRTVGGYLRLRADRDLVMVVIGDHQPPSLVSGEGASWNVPVHVISSRDDLLNRLRHRRFVDGLAPTGSLVGRMDGLLQHLLDAFGEPTTEGRTRISD